MKLFEWEFNCELHLKINIKLSTDINLDDMKCLIMPKRRNVMTSQTPVVSMTTRLIDYALVLPQMNLYR